MDLRQAEEMTKRIVTKEKIDRQLAGQTISTPFMNIKEEFGKKVTFDTMDGIEQKIDKLMVMMGKLVMEDEGQNRQFKPWYISLIEAEVRLDVMTIREDFITGFEQTMHTEDEQGMDKAIEVGQDMIQIIEVVMDIIQEVIKGIGDRILITTEEETLEIKITIEIGVGHTKGRIEIEGMVEALVTVDQDEIQGQLQTEIGLDALNVENATILQGTV